MRGTITFRPRLKDEIWLKRLDSHVLVHGTNPSHVKVAHPSHAFVLSLCTGAYSRDEIAYLFGECYGLRERTAVETVLHVLEEFRFALDTRNTPVGANAGRYDPREFVYQPALGCWWEGPPRRYPTPAGINITLTWRCQFRCQYCYVPMRNGEACRSDLDRDRCFELVDEAARMGIVFFGMTGGEPTLFEGWLQLVRRAVTSGLVPVITSNGLVIGSDPAIPRQLAAAGLRHMTISLDASNEELHNDITRSRHSFEKVRSAIRWLAGSGIRVSVKHVLTTLNWTDVAEFLDLIAQSGASEVGITTMECGGRGSAANSLGSLTADQLRQVRAVVLHKGRQHAGRCDIHPPKETGCALAAEDVYPCGGLFMGMSIFPSGDVTICDKLYGVPEFTYGNIYRETLAEVWNGAAFGALRERAADKSAIDPVCAACKRLDGCLTGCFVDSYNLTGDYFARHPSCPAPQHVSTGPVTV